MIIWSYDDAASYMGKFIEKEMEIINIQSILKDKKALFHY